MLNLIAQEIRFLDSSNAVVRRVPSSGVAVAHRGPTKRLDPVDGIPVDEVSPVTHITGLPDEGDIVVALVVTEAMRVLGLRHRGRVFSPMPLVFTKDEAGKPVGPPLGTPGLLLHSDLSA